jgi:hypothetical protein
MTQTLEHLDYSMVTDSEMELITRNMATLVLLSPEINIDAEREKPEYNDRLGTFVLGYN